MARRALEPEAPEAFLPSAEDAGLGAFAARLERELEQTARDGGNLMPPFIEAVKAYATLGEIIETLKGVYGEYTEPIII